MDNIKIYAFSDEASSNIDKQIVALKRNQLDGVEIRNVNGVNVADITITKAQEVKQKLDAAGLAVWSIGSPIGKIDIDDDFASHLQKFKHTIEIAKIFGCNNIRIFSFYIPPDKNPDIYSKQVLERLSKFIEIANESNINLCHENEKGIFGDTPERCAFLHKNLPELKAVFDPANFIQCGVNTIYAWECLKKYVHYLHIKDALSNGNIVPAGYGCGNIKNIAEDFIKMGGKNFTIEPHLTLFDGLSALEKEDNTSIIGEFEYENSDIAFDTACKAFKEIIGG